MCIYLCKLRNILFEFSDKNRADKALSLGVSINENNISEINQIINLVEKHDPFLLVRLFDIRQRMGNIR
ncbi:MAG: hypothetical protein PF482_14530, partial [Desulfobacteraceae bacterium]|nr:hypothetical protein [Desulfobacteraceae bacterium]